MHNVNCKKLIITENKCSFSNLIFEISLFLTIESLALLIDGVSICLQKIKVITKIKNDIILINSSSYSDIKKPIELRINPNK
tara:strand:- start:33 stop:278 length:246 start_codon:yes stop_codon:yes gene_type:complete